MNIEPVLDGIAIQHLYLHPIWPDLSPEWKTIGNKPSLGFPPPCASGYLALRRTSPDGIGVSSCALRTSMLCPLAPCGVGLNAPPITSPNAALRVLSPFRHHQNEL